MADIEPTPLDLTWGSFTENGPWNVDREQLAWMRGIRVLRLATRGGLRLRVSAGI